MKSYSFPREFDRNFLHAAAAAAKAYIPPFSSLSKRDDKRIMYNMYSGIVSLEAARSEKTFDFSAICDCIRLNSTIYMSLACF